MENLGITIEFLGKDLHFDKTVANANKAINTLKKEVAILNKQLKLDPNSFEKLTKKMENLRKQEELAKYVLEEYVSYLETLNRKGTSPFSKEWQDTQVNIQKANDKLLGIQKQIANLNVEMEKFKNGWSIAADQIEKVANAAGDLGDKLAPISKVSQDFLSSAIKQSIEFEDAFADVEKTVNATDNEFNAIRISLRELSKTLPTSASELSRIAGLAGQMNVPTDQIIKFTKAMVDFGNATDITAEEATKEIAQIYNVIGKGGDFSSLDNLLSAIVELGNNTATTESAIVEMFRNIAAASSRVGMTEQQMTALAATLSSLGLDKGGASAISKIMTNIDRAVDTNSSKLAEWANVAGMSAAKFKELWGQDASAGLLAVVEGIAKSNEAGTSFNETLEELGIKEIRQVDTLSRLVNAHEAYADNIEMASRAFEDGTALSAEATKRYNTLASQLQILKNNFLELAMQIGDLFLPTIRFLVDAFKDLADRFNELSPQTKDAIAKLLLFTAVISPLLLLVKNFLTPLASIIRFIGNIKTLMMTLHTTLQIFWMLLQGVATTVVQFIATSWGWIAAIFALIAVFKILYENCDGFRELVNKLIDRVKDLWERFKETNWIELLGEKFGWFGEIIGAVIELVKTLFGWLGNLISKALEFIGIKDSIGSGLGNGGGYGGRAMSVINSRGFGALNSGGYASGGVTLNASFNVSSNNITRADVRSWANWLADDINTELGRRI